MTNLSHIDLSVDGVQINFAEGTKTRFQFLATFLSNFAISPNTFLHPCDRLAHSRPFDPGLSGRLQQKSGVFVFDPSEDLGTR